MEGGVIRLPLDIGPGVRISFALLSAALALGLFVLLPATDAIQHETRPTLRLMAAPATTSLRRNPRPRLEVSRPAASGAATKAVAPAQTPVPHLTVRNTPKLHPSALRLPAGALSLSVNSLQNGVGDFSADFRVLPSAEKAVAAPAPAPPTVVKPFTVRDLDTPPRLLARVSPLYPLVAKQRKIEGYVDIEFYIERNGGVGDISVIGGEPSGLFDAAACNAVRRWRFSTPKKNGKAVRVLARQRIQFKLEKP